MASSRFWSAPERRVPTPSEFRHGNPANQSHLARPKPLTSYTPNPLKLCLVIDRGEQAERGH